MRKASIADRKKVVSIITHTFMENPGVLWMISTGNRKKKIKRLAEYAFIKSLARDGAFLSDNEKGAALCYIQDDKKPSIRETFYQLRFALTSVNFSKLSALISREKQETNSEPKIISVFVISGF